MREWLGRTRSHPLPRDYCPLPGIILMRWPLLSVVAESEAFCCSTVGEPTAKLATRDRDEPLNEPVTATTRWERPAPGVNAVAFK